MGHFQAAVPSVLGGVHSTSTAWGVENALPPACQTATHGGANFLAWVWHTRNTNRQMTHTTEPLICPMISSWATPGNGQHQNPNVLLATVSLEGLMCVMTAGFSGAGNLGGERGNFTEFHFVHQILIDGKCQRLRSRQTLPLCNLHKS